MSHANTPNTDADTDEEADVAAEPHLDQSIPYEWKSYRVAGETLVVQDVPEETVACYRVVQTSRNPRVLARADAVLYDGKVTTPFYRDETRQVIFSHSWAGTIDRVFVEDWLDAPAVILEACETTDITAAVRALEESA